MRTSILSVVCSAVAAVSLSLSSAAYAQDSAQLQLD